jgi:2-polyprenyl-3-methyl-5-hydroxy-6-metoxy-1,4-benzoquinol methylase
MDCEMEKREVDILWPACKPAEIQETEFSYKFCRRESKTLCTAGGLQFSWFDYGPGAPLAAQIAQCMADRLLIITDPEIVISPSAVERMLYALDQGSASCGPVFNQTTFVKQRAALPQAYVNVSTFLEVAEIMAGKMPKAPTLVDALDPGCVMHRKEQISGLNSGETAVEFHRRLSQGSTKGLPLMVDRGALVHRFGDYYWSERDDLVSLVPPGVKRILDVGCARGGYGKRLKERCPDVIATGLEMNPVMAQMARAHYDEFLQCAVEDVALSESFDLINCGDIIEHLMDPWQMLERFHGLLRRGGYLVLSLPNIGHWSVVKDIFHGKFQYVPVGILCMSHIRWFTEASIRRALEEGGFRVDVFDRQKIPPTPAGQAFIDGVCASGFADRESLETNEFVIRAVKA